jgi:ubiquinone/menaquinone biosynthesis C-methylase UbiE
MAITNQENTPMTVIKVIRMIVLIHCISMGCFAQGRYTTLELQNVVVEDFKAEGYILDIGGGGEGVIGQLKGQQVIAIDISRRELEEAPSGGLKLVMDARDLTFLDASFNTATSFFTLMYINGRDQEKVFREVSRVLKPQGRFLIWEVVAPQKVSGEENGFIVPLKIRLPEREVQTGYGTQKPEIVHNLDYYIQLAEKTGFKVVTTNQTDMTFSLELEKQ